MAFNSTQLQINNQISACIGSGASTVQFAMGTTGVGMQYGSATGIFANSTYIEVNGPATFDNVTTFNSGFKSYSASTLTSSLDNTGLLSCSGLSLAGGVASYTSDGSSLTSALSSTGGLFCSQVVTPLVFINNSLNVGSTASPTQLISSTGNIAAPSVSASSLIINSLATIDNTGKVSANSLNINSLATIDNVGKLTTKSLSVNNIVISYQMVKCQLHQL